MDFYPSELLLFLYQAPPSNKENYKNEVMLLINLNTSTLEIFLQEHPDAIFSVSPFFLKLFFYSKKYKRIFALKSSIKDNDDIFSFLKKNAEQYSFSIKSLAQDVYRNGTDPNHSLMIERFSTEASFGMTPAEFVNKYTLALEYHNKGKILFPNKIYFWNYDNQALKSRLRNPFSGDYCPKSIERDILNRRKMIDVVSEDDHFKRGFFIEWVTKEVEELCSNEFMIID